MAGVLRPVGPQPARVYWVRRAVVLAGVLLVVVVVALAVGATRGDAAGSPFGAGTAAQDAEGGSAEGEATEGGSADDAAAEGSTGTSDGVGPVACEAAALSVTLTAEGRSFDAPAAPTFAFAVTNTGEVPCTVDAGSGNQVVTATSGSDRVWSSTDCADDSGERLLLLQPGAQDVVPLPWDRTRSDEACSAGLPAPGAGTYQAVGTMLGAASAPFVFELG